MWAALLHTYRDWVSMLMLMLLELIIYFVFVFRMLLPFILFFFIHVSTDYSITGLCTENGDIA